MKIVLITGATGGIGKQIAISLAKLGFTIVITGRNKENGEAAVTEIQKIAGNNNIELLIGDLSSFDGITSLVEQFCHKFQKLDILIHNAGSATQKLLKSKNGIELNFAINVIAPFLLTKLLLSSLKNSDNPMVICVTGGDIPKKLEIDNIQCEKVFKGLASYSQSKLMMMIVMYELSQQNINEKFTVNICYPGQASTIMTQSVTKEMFPKLMQPIFPIFKMITKPDNGKSAQKASKSSVFLATKESLKDITGKYYNKKCKEIKLPACVLDIGNRKYLWNYVNNLIT
jgi:NAD(P)-dependent dehydrogenase (short-subunit alcohol dehydrogenase family)